MLPKFSYIRPGRLENAVSYLEKEGAAVHAGGTDLLGCLRERIIEAETVVSISGLEQLKGIRQSPDGGIQIGALTTITELNENEQVRRHFSGLAEAAGEVASPQLRNQGTVGGNLCQKPRCWYYRGEFDCRRKGGDTCYALGGENQFHAILGHDFACAITHPSDTAPALAALGARVQISGPEGKRSVPVEDFHVPPAVDPTRETILKQGEVVTGILVPPVQSGTYSSYRKIRARRAWDFALAGGALVLSADGSGRIERARVVLSGAAPFPWRSKAAEEVLTGEKLHEKNIAEAADKAMEKARPLSDNGYKVAMFKGMLQEELLKAKDYFSS